MIPDSATRVVPLWPRHAPTATIGASPPLNWIRKSPRATIATPYPPTGTRNSPTATIGTPYPPPEARQPAHGDQPLVRTFPAGRPSSNPSEHARGEIDLWIAGSVTAIPGSVDTMTLDTSRPFTRAQALAGGLRVVDLAGPQFQRIFHGVYLPNSRSVGVAERAAAALMVCPAGTYVSHHTAGALWGGWVPDTSEVHVSVPDGAVRSRRRGIWAHRADPATVPTRQRGITVSPPVAVFLELAALRVSLVDLVVFGDSMVRAQRITPELLVATVNVSSRGGARLARQAAALVREGSDSAPESRLRLLLVLAGLPEPEINRIIRTADGEWLHRFDLCYPALRLIIEYDGRTTPTILDSGMATSCVGSR